MPPEGSPVSTESSIKSPGRKWLSPRNLLLLPILAGLVYTLAGLAEKYLSREDRTQQSPAQAAKQARQDPSFNLQPILSARLFGAPDADQPTAKPAQMVEKTKLRLILQGVIATDGADAIAIISVNQGEAQIHRVGQPVMPGVTLHEVGRAHVILERDGRLEQLDLFDGPVAGQGTGTAIQEDSAGQQDPAANQEADQGTQEDEEQNKPGLRPGPYLRANAGSSVSGQE